jgi:hypothetical protein
VLVALQEDAERPRFYVIPRDHVAAMVYAEHKEWLETPGRGGKPHNPNDQRNLTEDDVSGYLERWDLLDRSTAEVEYLGDPRFLPLFRKYPLAEHG